MSGLVQITKILGRKQTILGFGLLQLDGPAKSRPRHCSPKKSACHRRRLGFIPIQWNPSPIRHAPSAAAALSIRFCRPPPATFPLLSTRQRRSGGPRAPAGRIHSHSALSAMDGHRGDDFDAANNEDKRESTFPAGDAAWFAGAAPRHFSTGAGSSHVTNPRLGLDSLDINGGEGWSRGPSYTGNYPGEYNMAGAFPPPIRVPGRTVSHDGAFRPPASVGGGPNSPFSRSWSPPPARSGAAGQQPSGDIGRAFSPPCPPRHPSWSTTLRPASSSPSYRRGTGRTQRAGRAHGASADGDFLPV